MKSQSKKFQIISILIIICISFSLLNITAVKAAETKPTLGIGIYKIQKEDEIEGFLEGEPDWQYFISVWNGESWDIVDNSPRPSTDPIIVNEVHFFEVTASVIQIRITLWDLETVGSPDLADISGYVGGGRDNWGGETVPRGARYYGTYNLKTNSLSGDTTYLEGGYYKTSGDYDGSMATDENDASLWFNIGDDYDSPKARAGPDQTAMVGAKVNFVASSSTASTGSSLVQFQWDFESDGDYDAQGEQTSYTYTEKGVYTVKLKVTDSIGETDTDTCIVNVITPPKPVADAGLDQTTKIGERVDFDGSGSTASIGATIERYQWDFENDGVYDSEGENTFWTYDTEGTYTAKLKVTDNYGQTDTDTCIVRVRIPPIQTSFTYTPQEHTIQDTVYFYDTSTDPDGSIVSWNWGFGDGFTSTLKDPTHDYSDKGSYTVTLTVTDNDGNLGTFEEMITVLNLPPTADFIYSPSSPIAGRDIHFSDKSSDPEGKSLECLWDFGDGTASTKENPVHRYEEGGEYTVKLTVTDDADDTEDKIKIVKILQTHDLTVEVKDILGVKIADAEIELYADGERCASGKTDTNGKLTFTEIAEGQYDIKVKVMGQTVSITRSLSQPVTAQVQVTLSTNTLGITGGIVVIAALAGFYLMRRKKTALPTEETNQKVESVSVVEDDSLKEKKKELERERIAEILQTFKNSFEKGEMDEETYLKLKAKYEKELEELE